MRELGLSLSLSLCLLCEDHQTLELNCADPLTSGSPASRISRSQERECSGRPLRGAVPMWEHQEGLPWPSTG